MSTPESHSGLGPYAPLPRFFLTDVLFISMPFGPVMAPSIGLSLLKAGLERCGITSDVRYFSIRFAEVVGWPCYAGIANGTAPTLHELTGEWIFNGGLFDITGQDEKRYIDEILIQRAAWGRRMPRIPARVIERIRRARSHVGPFLDWCVERVLEAHPRVVGFTSTFQQHVASLALARRIRERNGEIAIIFGGANVEGAMGAETVRCFPFVDAAVSGEGDVIVPELVRRILDGKCVDGLAGVRTPAEVESNGRVAWSSAPMVADLDSLPIPDYSDYFGQFHASRLARTWQPMLFFESSRGCWWGQKQHCTFCGLNGTTMTFRSKSPQRAIDELVGMTEQYPGSDVQTVDNILDVKYFDDFIPALAKLPRKTALFYETKSNLRKDQVRKLRDAGITRIQPGIESLSDSVLRGMRKGVSGLQNLQLLKWCKELGIEPYWNLIWGFPGEDPAEYERMAEVVPLVTHLPPPISSAGLRLDRFSPHFERSAQFGLTDVRPLAPYRHIYRVPDESLHHLASFFSYDYADGRVPERYARPLLRRIRAWISDASSADLFSIDLGPTLLVFDLRPDARQFLTALSGLDRELYLAADAVTHANALSERFRESPEVITRRLAKLVEGRLLLQDGHRFLALAIPVGDYQPNPKVRARFRRKLQMIGRRVARGTRIDLADPVPTPLRPDCARKHTTPYSVGPWMFILENERTILVRNRRSSRGNE